MPLIFMEEVEVAEKNKYRLLKFTVVGSNRILAYIDQTKGPVNYVLNHTDSPDEVL